MILFIPNALYVSKFSTYMKHCLLFIVLLVDFKVTVVSKDSNHFLNEQWLLSYCSFMQGGVACSKKSYMEIQ